MALTEREIKLKETIKEIIEKDLTDLWKNHRKNAQAINGFVNMSLVKKTIKSINKKLKEFER